LGGANPARVRTVVRSDLPRPRDYQSGECLALIDHLYGIITGSELPDVGPAAREPGFIEPLPHVSPAEIIGLSEYLDARGGKSDVFRIAAQTHQEFGQVITIVKAAEMLNFVDTPRSAVLLDTEGKRFVQASPAQRTRIWREQLLKLALFQEIAQVLRKRRSRVVDRDFVLETIVMRMPQENYEKVFQTFITWARFGELFSYDETQGTIALYQRRQGPLATPRPNGSDLPTPPGSHRDQGSAS
jgi:NitT/TauT family transport system ATP-binding protein